MEDPIGVIKLSARVVPVQPFKGNHHVEKKTSNECKVMENGNQYRNPTATAERNRISPGRVIDWHIWKSLNRLKIGVREWMGAKHGPLTRIPGIYTYSYIREIAPKRTSGNRKTINVAPKDHVTHRRPIMALPDNTMKYINAIFFYAYFVFYYSNCIVYLLYRNSNLTR